MTGWRVVTEEAEFLEESRHAIVNFEAGRIVTQFLYALFVPLFDWSTLLIFHSTVYACGRPAAENADNHSLRSLIRQLSPKPCEVSTVRTQ